MFNNTTMAKNNVYTSVQIMIICPCPSWECMSLLYTVNAKCNKNLEPRLLLKIDAKRSYSKIITCPHKLTYRTTRAISLIRNQTHVGFIFYYIHCCNFTNCHKGHEHGTFHAFLSDF